MYNLPSVVVICCRLVLLAILCLPSVPCIVCIKSNTILKTLRWFAQVAGGAKPPRNVAVNISEKRKVANALKRIYLL